MKENRIKPEDILLKFYHRNGYMRCPKRTLTDQEKQTYKKGYEIRLVARSETELKEICQALRKTGFKPGKPFQKARQIVQPIYGKQQFEHFNLLLQNAAKSK